MVAYHEKNNLTIIKTKTDAIKKVDQPKLYSNALYFYSPNKQHPTMHNS